MNASSYVLPLILGIFGIGCIFSKKDVQGQYLSGATEGVKNAFSLIPTLVILMTALSMFGASGASDIIASLLRPITSAIGIPSELTPLIIVRPLSGSGSTALLNDVLQRYGADSHIGISASILCASSDTVLYIVSVYTASAGIKRSRHALPCALAVMLLGTVLSCLLARSAI